MLIGEVLQILMMYCKNIGNWIAPDNKAFMHPQPYLMLSLNWLCQVYTSMFFRTIMF